MISEQIFKKDLISKLNQIHPGWHDGDILSASKSADIVNDELKIVIEIKDDILYKMLIPTNGEMVSQTTDLTQKNRQLKNHIKLANKKIINYINYKSILIIRTELADRDPAMIDYIINGPQTYSKLDGNLVYSGRPSTFFNDHDNSTNEIGTLIFWGHSQFVYRKNINPNVNNNRCLDKNDVECIFGMIFI